jgi:hypothetical protein
MTFSEIRSNFWRSVPDNFRDDKAIKLINKAVPSMLYLARPNAAKYYEKSEDDVPKLMIVKYVLSHYDYDAIDVGKIVKALQEAKRV